MEEVRKQKEKWRKEIQEGVKQKILFFECDHVENNELPARVNLYLSTNRRALLCKVCAHAVYSTIQEFFVTEYKRDKLDDAIKKAENALSEIRDKYPKPEWWQFWRK